MHIIVKCHAWQPLLFGTSEVGSHTEPGQSISAPGQETPPKTAWSCTHFFMDTAMPQNWRHTIWWILITLVSKLVSDVFLSHTQGACLLMAPLELQSDFDHIVLVPQRSMINLNIINLHSYTRKNTWPNIKLLVENSNFLPRFCTLCSTVLLVIPFRQVSL